MFKGSSWARLRCLRTMASSERLFLDKRLWLGRLPHVMILIGIAQASRTTSEPKVPRMTARVSRGQLISRGAKGGAAFFLTGSLAGSLVDSPPAADTVPDSDLAYARLLVGAELLGLDFYTRAIASKRLRGDALGSLKRARLNEQRALQQDVRDL